MKTISKIIGVGVRRLVGQFFCVIGKHDVPYLVSDAGGRRNVLCRRCYCLQVFSQYPPNVTVDTTAEAPTKADL